MQWRPGTFFFKKRSPYKIFNARICLTDEDKENPYWAKYIHKLNWRNNRQKYSAKNKNKDISLNNFWKKNNAWISENCQNQSKFHTMDNTHQNVTITMTKIRMLVQLIHEVKKCFEKRKMELNLNPNCIVQLSNTPNK